jgi:hypothetical protein
MAVILWNYKRILKRDMNKELSLQVNSAISQYFALGDRSFRAPTGTGEQDKEIVLDKH